MDEPLVNVRNGIRSGQPCFVGTRIAVKDVVEYLRGGMSTQEVLADFPELSETHLAMALEMARQPEPEHD
jgi:uncharacterized protein (DUF433 family)